MTRRVRLPWIDAADLTRRGALLTIGAGAMAAACSGGAPHDGGTDVVHVDQSPTDAVPTDAAGTDACTPLPVSLGDVSSYAVGSWTLNTDDVNNPLVIGRDANGIFVMTAVCTHSFCTLNPPQRTGVLFCTCHHSRFDGNGAVINGPAILPLDHYAVAVCGTAVSCDINTIVDAATRTPVT